MSESVGQNPAERPSISYEKLLAQSDMTEKWRSYLRVGVHEGFNRYCGELGINLYEMTYSNAERQETIEAGLTFLRNRSLLWVAAQQAVRPNLALLPQKTVELCAQRYYQAWLSKPENQQGSVYAQQLQQHQRSFIPLAYQFQRRFPEVQFAEILRGEFAARQQSAAAKAMQEILSIYGEIFSIMRKTGAYGQASIRGSMEA